MGTGQLGETSSKNRPIGVKRKHKARTQERAKELLWGPQHQEWSGVCISSWKELSNTWRYEIVDKRLKILCKRVNSIV